MIRQAGVELSAFTHCFPLSRSTHTDHAIQSVLGVNRAGGLGRPVYLHPARMRNASLCADAHRLDLVFPVRMANGRHRCPQGAGYGNGVPPAQKQKEVSWDIVARLP